jgi:rhodanese-related sulfurtransferase
MESVPHPVVLDVRSAQEWVHDHVEGAINVPLPQLLRHLGRFSRNTPLTILCGSGYRSSIATSLLESEGFERLSNVMGGLHAVRHAKRPRLPAVELAENVLTWEIWSRHSLRLETRTAVLTGEQTHPSRNTAAFLIADWSGAVGSDANAFPVDRIFECSDI